MYDDLPIRPFYSEHREDRWLEEHIFKGKRDGYFVEIGAMEGTDWSNTYFFEKERNWTGICVEPNPIAFKELAANRKCVCLNVAFTSHRGKANFLRVGGIPRGWSGLVDFIEPESMDRIRDREFRGELTTEVISVDTCLFTDLIWPTQKIDLLSIDVEGAEFDIISTVPFEKYDIDILVVEINYNFSPLHPLHLFITNNFDFLQRLGVSNIYRRR